MVSHELRTPLATLFVQIERLKLDPDVDADRRKLVTGEASKTFSGSRFTAPRPRPLKK